MKIPFAHLCDYATVSQEGKLSILGIFTNINAAKLPATHPQMYLAFDLQVSAAEVTLERAFDICSRKHKRTPLPAERHFVILAI